MSEDRTRICRLYISNHSGEAFSVNTGESEGSMDSAIQDHTVRGSARARTPSVESMISILSVYHDDAAGYDDDDNSNENNSVTKEDAIMNLSLNSKRLTGLRVYIRGTFQWFPSSASVTKKAICTTMQFLIVVFLVCCYSFEMGAFHNRSLVEEEMKEAVTAAKNIIWSLRMLELNLLGVLYFRKRHLERMLSNVILTRRYWKKTQKTIKKAIIAVFFCVIVLPVFLKAVQMNLSTRRLASFDTEQIILANSLSVLARLAALPMFIVFIYAVYIIFSQIRYFKQQVQKWPENELEKASNRFKDIKIMIQDAERSFQPFLITHLLLLMVLLIPSIFSCAERFQTEIYYKQEYSDPMMLNPAAAKVRSNMGLTVTNVSSFYSNKEEGFFVKILVTGQNKTQHQRMTGQLPFEYTENRTDVKEVVKIACSVLGDFLEMVVLYTLPLVFLAKLHKIMRSLPEVVRDLKYSEQREKGYLFQDEQIRDAMLADLSTGRGIRIMRMNLTGVKAALVTLLMPFLTAAFHLLMLHVDLN